MTETHPDVKHGSTSITTAIERATDDLAALDQLLPSLAHLIEPVRGQRPMLQPAPTPEEREREARLIRQERWDQVENERNRRPTPGKSPAPVSIAATDAAVAMQSCLTQIERHLWRHLSACPWPPFRSDRSRIRKILQNLGNVTSGEVARAISRDTAAALRAVERVVDGEQVVALNMRCPYCHCKSLVLYNRDPRPSLEHRESPTEIIRCDSPRAVGCTCSTKDCPCQDPKDAADARHVWERDGGGWDMLAKLIAEHDRRCETCDAAGPCCGLEDCLHESCWTIEASRR